jgi:hypothetical protein
MPNNEEEVSLKLSASTGAKVNQETEKKEGKLLSTHKPNLGDVRNSSQEELVDIILSKSPDDFLPWEDIDLPSQGIFYQGRIPNGTVKVRPMGLATDKILATQRLAQTGQSIEHLFRYCVKFPSEFDPLELLAGDRMFLLYYIRGITHGNIYEFSVPCSNDTCKMQSTHSYDLNNIADTIKAPGFNKEPFKIVLPYLTESASREVWVEARFARGSDYQVMQKQAKIKQMVVGTARDARTGMAVGGDQNELDETVEQNLNLLITSVNGVSDRHKINAFVKRLHGRDTAIIRQTIRDNQPGIDPQIIVTCPQCETEMNIMLPITESFFRPTEQRKPGG